MRIEATSGAKTVRLSEAIEINPKLNRALLDDDSDVSFVPMAAVGAATGQMDASTVRKYREVKKGYTYFQEGDVLFAKVTPCMENGKMVIAKHLRNGIGFGSTEFHVLRPTADVDVSYLYHFVSSETYRKEAARHMTGAVGLRRVPTAFLENSEIPLPPIAEQKKLVAEIEKQFSRLNEAVANLKRVKANLKRYKAAVLKAAVEGRLVPTEADLARKEGRDYETGEQLLQRILETRRKQWTGKGKYAEPASTDLTDLPALPDGWLWTSVDQLAEVVRGASPRPAGDPKYFGGDIPWITVGTVTSAKGKFVRTSKETVTTLGKENSRFIEAGTLLLTNSGATLGVPKISAIGGCINDGVAALFVHNESIKLYLLHVFDSLTESLRRINQGAAQPNLNTAIIRDIKVALLPAAELQRLLEEIDRRVSIVQGIEGQVDLNLARAERMRQSVLAVMFGGGT